MYYVVVVVRYILSLCDKIISKGFKEKKCVHMQSAKTKVKKDISHDGEK